MVQIIMVYYNASELKSYNKQSDNRKLLVWLNFMNLLAEFINRLHHFWMILYSY